MTSVSDISINSDSSKDKNAEVEDNEPINVQELLDKEKEDQFDHLAR